MVVMPIGTPLVKSANTRRFGARVILYGDTVSESLFEALRLVDQDGLTMVHPYDDRAVIAGQGTIGLELVEQHASRLVAIGENGGRDRPRHQQSTRRRDDVPSDVGPKAQEER